MALKDIKYIDQHFFDTEGKTPEQLARIYYYLGSFYDGYAALGNKGISFRSKHGDLVDRVKTDLRSGHTIRTEQGGHYILKVEHAPDLRARLEQLGLSGRRAQRKFPESGIPEHYLQHLIRGLIENGVSVYPLRGLLALLISGYPTFLAGLNDELRDLAGVRREGKSTVNHIVYGHHDSVRIYNYIYSGFEFIEKSGLYIPSVKMGMEQYLTPQRRAYIDNREVRNMIDIIKSRMIAGERFPTAALAAGFTSVQAAYTSFKRVMGATPKKFVKRERMEHIRRTLRAPVTINTYGALPRPARIEHVVDERNATVKT